MSNNDSSSSIEAHREALDINDFRRREAKQQLIAGSVTLDVIKSLLSPEELQEVLRDARLMSFEFKGEIYFPSWQFTNDGLRPDLDVLRKELGVFGNSPQAADNVLQGQKYPELGYRTVIQAIDNNDRPDLQSAAWNILHDLPKS